MHVDGHPGSAAADLGEQGGEPVGGDLERLLAVGRLELVDRDVVEIRVGVEQDDPASPCPAVVAAAGWIGSGAWPPR